MPPGLNHQNNSRGTGLTTIKPNVQKETQREPKKEELKKKNGSLDSSSNTPKCGPRAFKYDLGLVAMHMMDDLIREGLVQDRRWHLINYKQCFFHRDGFDWLVDHVKREESMPSPSSVEDTNAMKTTVSVCSSFTAMEAYLEELRVKAERLGNLLIAAGYISHVCDEHKFSAANRLKLLFFRFNEERIRRQSETLRRQSQVLRRSSANLTSNSPHIDKPQPKPKIDIPIPFHSQPSFNYPDERQQVEIDLLEAVIDELEDASDSQQLEEERAALALLRAEVDRLHISNSDQYSPELAPFMSEGCPNLVYVPNDRPYDEVSAMSLASQIASQGFNIISRKMLACDPNREVDAGLLSIARDMHRDMTVLKQIRDRLWHLKVYKKCFLHEEALDWLATQVRFFNYSLLDEDERPLSEEQANQVAARVGNLLIYHGYLSHVCKQHIFRANATNFLFFRFQNHLIAADSIIANFSKMHEKDVKRLQRDIFTRETNVILDGGPSKNRKRFVP